MAKQPAHLKGYKPPKRLTNLEKAKRYAEKEELGRLLAKYKFKRSKKGLETSLREHFGKLIDRLDFVELLAVLGVAIIIKEIIETNEEMATVVKVAAKKAKVVGLKIGPFLKPIFIPGVPTEEEIKEEKVEFAPEWFEWLISFSIAYIIVKHAGSLIGLLEKGLTSVVSMLLGAIA